MTPYGFTVCQLVFGPLIIIQTAKVKFQLCSVLLLYFVVLSCKGAAALLFCVLSVYCVLCSLYVFFKMKYNCVISNCHKLAGIEKIWGTKCYSIATLVGFCFSAQNVMNLTFIVCCVHCTLREHGENSSTTANICPRAPEQINLAMVCIQDKTQHQCDVMNVMEIKDCRFIKCEKQVNWSPCWR